MIWRWCISLAVIALGGVTSERYVYRHRCVEKALEDREEQANVVLTGTVRQLMNDYEHPYQMKGEIEIKRVMKGNGVVNSVPTMHIHHHKKMVMVDGFGDPHICDSRVHAHDTRIFLLNRGRNGMLRLNSSLVRLSLNNLQRTGAAVRDAPYKQKTVTAAPCERKYCPFYARCLVDKTNNKPYCRCPQYCTNEFAPVCGTDDKTYTNVCKLQVASCSKQRRIKVRSKGKCYVRDPCSDVKCDYSAKCIPSIDSLTHRCICPERCDSYGDSVGSKPVCGDDGRDYANTCELERYACQNMRNIAAKYDGKCDPCDGYKCKNSEVCQLGKLRKPICRCNSNCEDDFNPVCGSNGHTYSNECFMKLDACKKREDITKIFHGDCANGANPCKKKQCRALEICQVGKDGQAKCICPTGCDQIIRRVCGSDGHTYDNECEMKRQACVDKKSVELAFVGECAKQADCTKKNCTHDSICVIKNNAPICECPVCSEQYDPVCGSDGVSYSNECKMKAENCAKQKSVVVRSSGKCNGCAKIKCDFNAVCESDNKGNARCVCPNNCHAYETQEVCGTDGVSYRNECELKKSSCHQAQYIIIASRGPCDRCANVKCRFGGKCVNGRCECPTHCHRRGPRVCANDGNTYTNECHMRKAACENFEELEIISRGECSESSGSGDHGSGASGCEETPCQFGGVCQLDAEDEPKCVCSFSCEAVRSEVCGSDGKVYSSECQIREESCKQQKLITVLRQGSCDGAVTLEEFCDGKAPLVDTKTGLEYKCSAGSNTCPKESYCHIIKDVAKCCRIVQTCAQSKFGCCPDTVTPAQDVNYGGCPSICQCNPLGSYGKSCDPKTRQCTCQPGVGGRKCDRCEPGFWGLHKIHPGREGCKECGCNIYGSIRTDCEQMSGRCVCKANIKGDKCNLCSNGKLLTASGCDDIAHHVPTCLNKKCYHGAECMIRDGLAECVCPNFCSHSTSATMICGSDSRTYGSECQLKQYACRHQKEIYVSYEGACGVVTPASATTLPPSGRARKTTRHLAPKDRDYQTPNLVNPTVSSTEFGIIGEICLSNKDCIVENSFCNKGRCECEDGYIADSDKTFCRVLTHENPNADAAPLKIDPCMSSPCQRGGTCIVERQDGKKDTFKCICPLPHGGSTCVEEHLSIPANMLRYISQIESVQADSPRHVNLANAINTTLTNALSTGNEPLELVSVTNADHKVTNTGDSNDVTTDFNTNTVGSVNSTPVYLSEEVAFDVPSFSGKSFLKMKRLMYANREVSIELKFRSLNTDCILLYAGQEENEKGDFISLAVVDGFVEFRYDLGGGPVILRSAQKIELKRFHHVVAKRFGQEGRLQLDGGAPITGKSPGQLQSLNVNTPLYLGYIPDASKEILRNIGVKMGLVGCLKTLKIHSKDTTREYDLHYPRSKDIISGAGISECGKNPCISLPCKNGGTCMKTEEDKFECKCTLGWQGPLCAMAADSCASNPCQGESTCAPMEDGGFMCKCPMGREGIFCEKGVDMTQDIFVPEFHGNSFIERSIIGNVNRQLSFEVWFLARSPNGVILYSTQHMNGKGDFISLNLVNGYLQFRFDLGGGIANLTSPGKIMLNMWHSVVVKRINRSGTMVIDSGPAIKGKSSGEMKELNLGPSIFIGGYKGIVNPDSGITGGLNGAIQRIYDNDHLVDSLLNGAISHHNIKQYMDQPCYPINPCRNLGICVPKLNHYECRCTKEFSGDRCQNASDMSNKYFAIKFDGRTYYRYYNKITRKQRGQKANEYKLRFRTKEKKGLMLIQHKSLTVQGDYLAIGINRGYVEVTYNLGKQTTTDLHVLRSSVKVNDGKWHTVQLIRDKRKASLILDELTPVTEVSVQGATQLDTDGYVWIGGKRSPPRGLPDSFYRGFRGCIEYVTIDDEPLDMVNNRKNHGSIEPCDAA